MRRIVLVVLMFAFCIMFVACGEKSTYEPGLWYDSTFSSSWIGIRYKLPEGTHKKTDDDTLARRYLYSGVFYGDKDEPTVKDLEEVVTIEMCAYNFEHNSFVWVMSEEIPDESLTVDDFIDEYIDIISNDIANVNYIEDKESVTVAGIDWRFVKLKYYGMGVYEYQYIYIMQKENRMNYIILECIGNDGEEAVPYLLGGLSAY